jgi:ATP-dependent RNA helicase SUPV3L1/SUV3
MPHEWYPEVRKIKRTIHYHMGPTNSGKTREAIQSLMSAKRGIYCAPLRLLAWEIHEKLNSGGVKCSLKTGQEKIAADNATHLSCTIEACNIERSYDVAVIDEIQLINDPDRGSAWSHCLLGLNAKEIHLCGDQRAFKLVSEIVESCGDEIYKYEYARLSQLDVEDKNVPGLVNLREGDAVIAFSKRQLFELRSTIN